MPAVPLFNSRGKCDFFLGGQVNCSTTIHSNVDVMKVLSMSDTADTDEMESQRNATTPSHKSISRPSARRTFLKALGVRHEDHTPLQTGDAGMENGVLGRMEGLDLSSQMKEFYTAYSKVSFQPTPPPKTFPKIEYSPQMLTLFLLVFGRSRQHMDHRILLGWRRRSLQPCQHCKQHGRRQRRIPLFWLAHVIQTIRLQDPSPQCDPGGCAH